MAVAVARLVAVVEAVALAVAVVVAVARLRAIVCWGDFDWVTAFIHLNGLDPI